MASARGSVVATSTITLVAIVWCMVLVADQRLRVETPGRFATEPAEWWVRVWVEPHEDDRNLRIITDGTEYQSTDVTLEGARAPRVHQVWVTPLGAGCYAFIAEVRTVGPEGPVVARAEAPWPLTVVGPGVDATTCE